MSLSAVANAVAEDDPATVREIRPGTRHGKGHDVAKVNRAQIDSNRFLEYINSDDDLTLVLRGHLSLEAVLNHVLDQALEGGVTGELENLRFMQRVDLVIGLGKIDADTRPLFQKINELRNRFGHQLDATLTRDDATTALALLPGWALRPPPEVLALDHPLGPSSAIGWCMSVLWSRAINRGLFGHAPELPVVTDLRIVPGTPS
jgi:hypothetical protein